jgi:hypothetical protein
MPTWRVDSQFSLVLKVAVPVLWVAMIVLTLFRLPQEVDPDNTLIGLGVFTALTAVPVWRLLAIKKLYIRGDRLFVSNFREEISIALDTVESVSQSRIATNNSPVTIRFQEPTAFGSAIRFWPPILPANSFRKHPVIDEINSTIRAASPITSRL